MLTLLPDLEELDIEKNKFKKLPSSLQGARKLKKLKYDKEVIESPPWMDMLLKSIENANLNGTFDCI